MKKYTSTSGKQSGVIEYQIGKDYILIRFINDNLYKYTHESAGYNTVELMKNMARAKFGLNTFISRNKPEFVR